MPYREVSVPCPVCHKPRMVRNEPSRITAPCMSCHLAKARAVEYPSDRFYPTKHALYGVWRNIRQRCENPKNDNFKYYGARGIFVCEEWRQSPALFIEWALSHGYAPELEIDRRDNDGPYSPQNCRYVTSAVNMHNSRRTKRSLEQVREIKQRISSGQRNRDIALHLQIDPRRVADIKTGKAFASI